MHTERVHTHTHILASFMEINYMMKLKHQISTRTNLDYAKVRENAFVQLKDCGYDIVESKENMIYFENRGWGVSSNQVGKADKGSIEILDSDYFRTITLTYQINFVYNIVCFIFIVCLSFFWGASLLVLAIGMILISLVQLVMTKSKHKNLISEMAKPSGN